VVGASVEIVIESPVNIRQAGHLARTLTLLATAFESVVAILP
jgi:hypothetical protein